MYQVDDLGGMLFYPQEVWLLLAKTTQRVRGGRDVVERSAPRAANGPMGSSVEGRSQLSTNCWSA